MRKKKEKENEDKTNLTSGQRWSSGPLHWRLRLKKREQCLPFRMFMLHTHLLRLDEEVSSLPLTSSMIVINRECCRWFLYPYDGKNVAGAFNTVRWDRDLYWLPCRDLELSSSSQCFRISLSPSLFLSSTYLSTFFSTDRWDRVQPWLLCCFSLWSIPSQIHESIFSEWAIREYCFNTVRWDPILLPCCQTNGSRNVIDQRVVNVQRSLLSLIVFDRNLRLFFSKDRSDPIEEPY